MRKRRGKEYRYTYYGEYSNNKKGEERKNVPKTINIITGEVKNGKWSVLDTDPTKFVKIGNPGALI